MKTRDRVVALLLGLPGALLCLLALARFVWRYANKGVGWHPDLTARDYTMTIGRFYSEGLATGFFLCFFVILAGLGIQSWQDARRQRPS